MTRPNPSQPISPKTCSKCQGRRVVVVPCPDCRPNPSPDYLEGKRLAPEYAALHRQITNAEASHDEGMDSGFCAVCRVPYPCRYAPVPENYPTALAECQPLVEALEKIEGLFGRMHIVAGYMFDTDPRKIARSALEAHRGRVSDG